MCKLVWLLGVGKGRGRLSSEPYVSKKWDFHETEKIFIIIAVKLDLLLVFVWDVGHGIVIRYFLLFHA